MKFPNRLPLGTDLIQGEDSGCGAALIGAVRVAEKLSGAPILVRHLEQECYLGDQQAQPHVLLNYFPVGNVTIEGRPADAKSGLWWEAAPGVIGTHSLPASSYHIEYSVGLEPGKIPEVLCELVRLLADWRLGLQEDAELPLDCERLLAIAGAARMLLEPARLARASYAKTLPG